MIRPPAVAGSFYPSDPSELAPQIEVFTNTQAEKISARGCIVPHAGYMYSGRVAGAVYSSLQVPSRCILLGPRHSPGGEPLAILTDGSWATPLGEVKIDTALASELARRCPRLRDDPVAHQREHSLEVQIPFLQRIVGENLGFVPVVLATDRFPVIEELGHAVAQAVSVQADPVLVIATTDMNHYESEIITREKDHRAIGRILALDPRGLYDTVRFDEISMCGYAATVAAIVAMRDLGARGARLIRYSTSGDVNGDRDRVVGYAGLVFT